MEAVVWNLNNVVTRHYDVLSEDLALLKIYQLWRVTTCPYVNYMYMYDRLIGRTQFSGFPRAERLKTSQILMDFGD